jgi:hypothetical protein
VRISTYVVGDVELDGCDAEEHVLVLAPLLLPLAHVGVLPHGGHAVVALAGEEPHGLVANAGGGARDEDEARRVDRVWPLDEGPEGQKAHADEGSQQHGEREKARGTGRGGLAGWGGR